MEIKVVRQILEWNEDCSNEIKETLKEKKVCLINVMGSPGAGKTSLILEMVKRLAPRYRAGVLEGDIAGEIDAKKMDEMGIPSSVALRNQVKKYSKFLNAKARREDVVKLSDSLF